MITVAQPTAWPLRRPIRTARAIQLTITICIIGHIVNDALIVDGSILDIWTTQMGTFLRQQFRFLRDIRQHVIRWAKHSW